MVNGIREWKTCPRCKEQHLEVSLQGNPYRHCPDCRKLLHAQNIKDFQAINWIKIEKGKETNETL